MGAVSWFKVFGKGIIKGSVVWMSCRVVSSL